jgi:drug/metabolite transporter (DMT)-like permease
MPERAPSSRPVPRTTILLSCALLTLVWGTTWAAIRIGLRGVPPFTAVALRFAIASALLFAIAAVRRTPLGRSRREWGLWVLIALFSFCGSYGTVYWASQWVPSGLAAVLFAIFPIPVALIAHFTLPEERLTLRGFGGVLVGFAGVAVIFSEDLARLGGAGVLRGALVILAAPLFSSVAYVATKKCGNGIPAISLAAAPMAMTALVMGGVAFLLERGRAIAWNGTSIGALLYLAVAGSALTFTVYYWLLANMPATRLALISYPVPVVAVLVGAIFLGEPVTTRVGLGAALVLGGVAMANERRQRG